MQPDLTVPLSNNKQNINEDNFGDCYVLQNITGRLDWLNEDYTNEK
jgi:hypothetical protein